MAGRTLEFETGADLRRAFLHADQTIMAGPGMTVLGMLKSGAVVGNAKVEGVRRGLEGDLDGVGAVVFDGVGNGVGGDAQQVVLEFGGQADGALIELELQPDVFGLGDLARGLEIAPASPDSEAGARLRPATLRRVSLRQAAASR